MVDCLRRLIKMDLCTYANMLLRPLYLLGEVILRIIRRRGESLGEVLKRLVLT
jgi:hypothetical protein